MLSLGLSNSDGASDIRSNLGGICIVLARPRVHADFLLNLGAHGRGVVRLAKSGFLLGVVARAWLVALLLLGPEGFPLCLADADGVCDLRHFGFVLAGAWVAIASLFDSYTHRWSIIGLAEGGLGFCVVAWAWEFRRIFVHPQFLPL